MSLKHLIKQNLPKPLHHLYNRVVSRRKIRGRHGDWFDLEWKHRAAAADEATWQAVYDQSWENWEQQDLSPIDLEQLVALIPANISLLDAGCGDGYLLSSLLGQGRILTGVDLSGKAIEKARERLGDGVTLQTASVEQLPFSNQQFEVVVSAHTLEHVRNFEPAVAELWRVCQQRLIILLPCQEYLPYTEDYHLHFFPSRESLQQRLFAGDWKITSHTVPAGICAYSGTVWIAVLDRIAT